MTVNSKVREHADAIFVDPFRILTDKELAPRPPLAPVEISPVGNYAYKIVWNDGHDTGLYTLEYLRQLCECPLCGQIKEG